MIKRSVIDLCSTCKGKGEVTDRNDPQYKDKVCCVVCEGSGRLITVTTIVTLPYV